MQLLHAHYISGKEYYPPCDEGEENIPLILVANFSTKQCVSDRVSSVARNTRVPG